ncbi:MAG: hypothetical protein CSB06_02645 [Bacteroidia bacterium]|nr:MAG: hypothetical protein CSB06_02645 [Bacteroidia bacterium]
MSVFDNTEPEKQQALYRNSLNAGAVFLKKFDEADHKKFFIIAGISDDKLFMCSVFINSKIHPAIAHKPRILDLQIPLLKTRNDFLKYDSFANCSYPIHLNSESITRSIVAGTCKLIGNIHNQDLEFVQNALIESGLLSDEEIELYFKD